MQRSRQPPSAPPARAENLARRAGSPRPRTAARQGPWTAESPPPTGYPTAPSDARAHPPENHQRKARAVLPPPGRTAIKPTTPSVVVRAKFKTPYESVATTTVRQSIPRRCSTPAPPPRHNPSHALPAGDIPGLPPDQRQEQNTTSQMYGAWIQYRRSHPPRLPTTGFFTGNNPQPMPFCKHAARVRCFFFTSPPVHAGTMVRRRRQ